MLFVLKWLGYYPIVSSIQGGTMAIHKAGAEPLDELASFLEPFSQVVRRKESKHALERYTTGLLSDLPRKTASDMGRTLPGTNDQRLQEFLTNTAWEAVLVMNSATASTGVHGKNRSPCAYSRPVFLQTQLPTLS